MATNDDNTPHGLEERVKSLRTQKRECKRQLKKLKHEKRVAQVVLSKTKPDYKRLKAEIEARIDAIAEGEPYVGMISHAEAGRTLLRELEDGKYSDDAYKYDSDDDHDYGDPKRNLHYWLEILDWRDLAVKVADYEF